MKLLKFITPALPILFAGLAQGQDIERVVVEDGQLKLQVRTPSISVEELPTRWRQPRGDNSNVLYADSGIS